MGLSARDPRFYRPESPISAWLPRRDTKTGDAPRHWRWRGFLVDYYTAECKYPKPGAPALLLVHGFGAFGEQWRGQIKALTAAGYQACPARSYRDYDEVFFLYICC